MICLLRLGDYYIGMAGSQWPFHDLEFVFWTALALLVMQGARVCPSHAIACSGVVHLWGPDHLHTYVLLSLLIVSDSQELAVRNNQGDLWRSMCRTPTRKRGAGPVDGLARNLSVESRS